MDEKFIVNAQQTTVVLFLTKKNEKHSVIKRFSNINIQRKSNKFSCIAIRNKVLIRSRFGYPITMGSTLEFLTKEVISNDI